MNLMRMSLYVQAKPWDHQSRKKKLENPAIPLHRKATQLPMIMAEETAESIEWLTNVHKSCMVKMVCTPDNGNRKHVDHDVGD